MLNQRVKLIFYFRFLQARSLSCLGSAPWQPPIWCRKKRQATWYSILRRWRTWNQRPWTIPCSRFDCEKCLQYSWGVDSISWINGIPTISTRITFPPHHLVSSATTSNGSIESYQRGMISLANNRLQKWQTSTKFDISLKDPTFSWEFAIWTSF